VKTSCHTATLCSPIITGEVLNPVIGHAALLFRQLGYETGRKIGPARPPEQAEVQAGAVWRSAGFDL
jgi:hypothetical protein